MNRFKKATDKTPDTLTVELQLSPGTWQRAPRKPALTSDSMVRRCASLHTHCQENSYPDNDDNHLYSQLYWRSSQYNKARKSMKIFKIPILELERKKQSCHDTQVTWLCTGKAKDTALQQTDTNTVTGGFTRATGRKANVQESIVFLYISNEV